nr:alpha/beta family hydrolase [Synechococcus sp. CS-205]
MTADAPTSAPRLIDGPDSAPATVLLVHGAGAPMDSSFMGAIASGLAQHGWRVVRFEFPYMARQRILERRQGPHRMPVLQEAFRQQVRLEKTEQRGRPVFISGKSMSWRPATGCAAVSAWAIHSTRPPSRCSCAPSTWPPCGRQP